MNPSEHEALKRILGPIADPVIFELGAYTLDGDPNFTELCGKEPIVHAMVEPDPDNYATILTKLKGNTSYDGQHWKKVQQVAVSFRIGTSLFFPSWAKDDHNIHASGSILSPTGHLDISHNTGFNSPIKVGCITLDQFRRQVHEDCPIPITTIDMLWVDIQGAEREMIAGGTETLKNTRYCFMETENVELYQGQALKPELRHLMANHGFRCIGDFDYNCLFEKVQ